MDREGPSPTKEHVFVVSIADNNGEESPEVFWLHNPSTSIFAPLVQVSRSSAILVMQACRWWPYIILRLLQRSECIWLRSSHLLLKTESHIIFPREWCLLDLSWLMFDFFHNMVTWLITHAVFVFLVSSGFWRCSGEAPVDMPSSWTTWTVHTSRSTSVWLNVLQVLLSFLKDRKSLLPSISALGQ